MQFRKICPLASQHLTPAPLTLQRTLTLLFHIKLAILLLHLLKSSPGASDPEASEGPSLAWRAEFTYPDHLPVGATIYKSSQSQRGKFHCVSSLGKKMPYETLFYFWLQWKTGHHPLGIIGIWRVQAFNKGKCPNSAQEQLSLVQAPAHSAPFPPSKSSPLFSLIDMTKAHLLPGRQSGRGTAEHHHCPVQQGPNPAGCAGGRQTLQVLQSLP